MFIEVTLPLPLTQSFFYMCPETSLSKIQPGQRVLVPFINRKLTAYVLKIHQELPKDFSTKTKLKSILMVLDEKSLIPNNLFEFACWVATYYFASPGEVLKSCFPPKINPNIRRIFFLTGSGRQLLSRSKSISQLSKRKSEILSLLNGTPALDQKQLENLAHRKIPTRELQELLDLEYINIKFSSTSEITKSKKRWYVSLHPDYKNSLSKLNITHKQESLIQQLENSKNNSISLVNLNKVLSLSSSSLKRLEKKGVLVRTQKQIDRNPFDSFEKINDFKTPLLSQEQKKALLFLTRALNSQRFSAVLLHGVTGSGKTEVYLRIIEETLKIGKTALVLMPEISLTPRIAQEFDARLKNQIAMLHSGLSTGERYDEWWRIKNGIAQVVIGTRSAVFAPIPNLGLIVVDEEHDPSFKQQESPRYHGRDVALVLGKKTEALVILGSATPSIESFHNANVGKYGYLRLSSRIDYRPLPKVELIDMRKEFSLTNNKSPISIQLNSALEKRLTKKEQSMILINRRGYSIFLLCRSCGQNIQCHQCSIALTFHKIRNALVCHYCDFFQAIPKRCPKCSSEHLYFMGEGSEKIENLLKEKFSQAHLARLDRDILQKKNAHYYVLNQFRQGKIDILTGTQMIAKGHDFPNVTLVGVISSDHSLSFPDFRASERTFQLLTQVSGRAGRGEIPGEVLIQSHYPEHYCFEFITSHNYHGFFEKEIRFRRFMHYPPFTVLALVLVKHRSASIAYETITNFANLLQKQKVPSTGIRILGPTQSPLARIRSEHRFQILIKSKKRSQLQKILKTCLHQAQNKGIDIRQIQIDMDPVNVM